LTGAQGLQGATGPSGTVGGATQPLSAVFLTSTAQVVPGSSVSFTITDPNNVDVAFIEADGDVFANGASGTYCLFQIGLVIDGNSIRAIRSQVVNVGTGNQSSSWHVHVMSQLTQGTHEAHLVAQWLACSANPVTLNSTSGRISILAVRTQ
jgi:hypothetical protein